MGRSSHEPVPLHLVDSVGHVRAEMAGGVIVSGSHGGTSAAGFCLPLRPRLAVFNDAGLGRDDAGIAGLPMLETLGCAACAVSHMSARIGEARSTLEHGTITHCNAPALALGIRPGMSCADAVRLAGATTPS